MSTWTSRAPLLAAAALAGCSGGVDVGLGAAGRLFSDPAPERIAVVDDRVLIEGPPGYCIDQGATRNDGAGAFVLLGSCASVKGKRRAPQPEDISLVTVSVSGGSTADDTIDTARLKDFFASDAGKAALSRSGAPETVEILETEIREGMFLVHARDTASAVHSSLSDDYWRGLLRVNGHLTTVSVIGFDSSPMSRDTGLRTLVQTADILRAANAEPPG